MKVEMRWKAPCLVGGCGGGRGGGPSVRCGVVLNVGVEVERGVGGEGRSEAAGEVAAPNPNPNPATPDLTPTPDPMGGSDVLSLIFRPQPAVLRVLPVRGWG